jgi:DNA-binding GntR family transcriptional regulator
MPATNTSAKESGTTAAPLPGAEIHTRSLREEVAQVLERAILTGVYEPGQRLVERELSERFGVSSIPIREALQELENRGLVTRRHNYGCSVVHLTAEEVDSICRLRQALEPKVVEWAAERMTPRRARELEAQLDKLAVAAEAGDRSEFFREDLLFHRMIWETSGNKYASRALGTAIGSLFASGLGGPQGRSIDLRREFRKHQRMLKALRSGDGVKAAQMLLGIAEGFQRAVEAETAG